LGMAAALQRVGVEIRLASRALSDELALVNQEMQTGVSRTDALRNLAERTGVEDIYSLVAMLIQTDRLGTSVAQSLRAHAESMRTRRRQRAEQQARKASIKLAFPLVFMIFPALLVIILGPAGIQLLKALSADHGSARRSRRAGTPARHPRGGRPVPMRTGAGRGVRRNADADRSLGCGRTVRLPLVVAPQLQQEGSEPQLVLSTAPRRNP